MPFLFIIVHTSYLNFPTPHRGPIGLILERVPDEPDEQSMSLATQYLSRVSSVLVGAKLTVIQQPAFNVVLSAPCMAGELRIELSGTAGAGSLTFCDRDADAGEMCEHAWGGLSELLKVRTYSLINHLDECKMESLEKFRGSYVRRRNVAVQDAAFLQRDVSKI